MHIYAYIWSKIREIMIYRASCWCWCNQLYTEKWKQTWKELWKWASFNINSGDRGAWVPARTMVAHDCWFPAFPEGFCAAQNLKKKSIEGEKTHTKKQWHFSILGACGSAKLSKQYFDLFFSIRPFQKCHLFIFKKKLFKKNIIISATTIIIMNYLWELRGGTSNVILLQICLKNYHQNCARITKPFYV